MSGFLKVSSVLDQISDYLVTLAALKHNPVLSVCQVFIIANILEGLLTLVSSVFN